MKPISCLCLMVGTSLSLFSYAAQLEIYGRVDTSVDYTKIEGQPSDTVLTNNASRLGFRGEEKITGDLKAQFQVEHSLDSSGTTSPISTIADRETFVGLQSKQLGTIDIGFTNAPTFLMFREMVGVFGEVARPSYTDNGPIGMRRMHRISGISDLGQRIRNSVYYKTPTLSDLYADILISKGDIHLLSSTLNPNYNHLIDARIQYGSEKSPFSIGASIRQAEMVKNQKNNTLFLLASKYKQEKFDIGAAYEFNDYDADDRENNKLYITGHYHISPQLTLLGSAGFARDYQLKGITQANTHSTQSIIALQYKLSQRTELYGYYLRLNNGLKSDYNIIGGSPIGKNNQDITIGIRHNF